VKSKLSVVVNVIAAGAPVANVLMPDTLQLSSNARATALLPSLVPMFGTSIV
jgi:hypothetical protein